jgi:Fe-S oxidoreductase
MASAFETALSARIDDMIEACTRCGKCVEACPITEAAGVEAQPTEVIEGIVDLVRTGAGSDDARRWASGCVLSGACIPACDYGVNPRFLLAMARTRRAQATSDPREQRRRGVEMYRKVGHEVGTLSRLQLDDELLARLGQGPATGRAEPTESPDFIFYTGCNVLKTPHIALTCLDIMDALGISYQVMGGPTHCCGVVQLRTGDVETAGRLAEATIDKLSASRTGQVISWCPSCQVQFTENTLPTVEKMRGSRPFEMVPFMHFLLQHLHRLSLVSTHPLRLRLALHRHPGVPGVVAAVEAILRALPGVELVDLAQPAVGLQANSLMALPELRRALQRAELEAARAAGVDALVGLYHSDHRELCAHERDYPFEILNVVDVIAMAIGLRRTDDYKRLKLLQDVDGILADCSDLIAHHRLDAAAARSAVTAMLAEQPVPLA